MANKSVPKSEIDTYQEAVSSAKLRPGSATGGFGSIRSNASAIVTNVTAGASLNAEPNRLNPDKFLENINSRYNI